MLISCPHQHSITCTNVNIHLLNVPLQGLCVNSNSLNLLLFVMNNRNGSTYIGTVHQDFQCFDISRGLGGRVSQIMTFDWMWTGTRLFKRETGCRGWDHKNCHVIRWGVSYSLFTFWCSFIFGAGILLQCYLYLSSTNWMIKIDIALRKLLILRLL